MKIKRSNRTSQRGFTLVEITIVVSIGTVLMATAAPNMMRVVTNARLRGAATSLSSILQDTRGLAIKLNRAQTLRFASVQGGPYAYVKAATDSNTTRLSLDPQVQLGAPIIQVSAPASGDTVTALDNSTLGFTALTYPDLPTFNAEGMPCKYVSGVCTPSGFVYYFTETHGGWTAVSVSPAGRMASWFWNGSKWGN